LWGGRVGGGACHGLTLIIAWFETGRRVGWAPLSCYLHNINTGKRRSDGQRGRSKQGAKVWGSGLRCRKVTEKVFSGGEGKTRLCLPNLDRKMEKGVGVGQKMENAAAR